MKLLYKITLLAMTMAPVINAPHVLAAGSPEVSGLASAQKQEVTKNAAFKNDDQQSAYALGASFARYMESTLKDYQKIGISLDKSKLIAGFNEALAGKSKLSEQEITDTLKAYQIKVSDIAKAKMEKEASENAEKGEAFAAKFAKENGVKKSSTGLLYKIEKTGSGKTPEDSDTVVVNYTGKLIDGTEFDNSYKRGEPASFQLDGVIPGWTEGLKYIKKGGKIKLVVPADLAYGKNGYPHIPINSTLVFDVELLDIKPAASVDNGKLPASTDLK